MKLTKASHKAIKYATLNFHYAKRVPVVFFAYNVFNNKDEWCGVISFAGGASSNMGKPYGLRAGQYLELNRMALNGKQESTSKALSIAIRLVKKDAPTVKVLISYADKGQEHIGVIYQATNWIYTGDSKTSGYQIYYKGEWVHNRVLGTLPKKQRETIKRRKSPGKYRYIYILDKEYNHLKETMGKLYPKK